MPKHPDLFVLEEWGEEAGPFFSGLFTAIDKAEDHICRLLAKRHNLKTGQIRTSYDGAEQIIARYRVPRAHPETIPHEMIVEFQFTKAIIDPEGA